MGDGGLPIPPSVTVVDISTGSNCTSEKCCWQGKTSKTCQDKNTSNNGGYSGCTRTVCNYAAANEICAKYTAGGKTWRLPKNSEMANWYNYTIALGAAGPQICIDYNVQGTCSGLGNPTQNTDYGITKCSSGATCKGGLSDTCNSPYIWAQNGYYGLLTRYTSGSWFACEINNSWQYSGTRDKTYAQSVRCVTAIEY